MSIIERNSVLIIGAGVSKPFGIPLGGEMMDKIQEGLAADQRAIRGNGTESPPRDLRGYVVNSFSSLRGFWSAPYWGSVLSRNASSETREVDREGLNRDIRMLMELENLLSNQTSETIDDFIVENPSYSDILKSCIGVEIAKSTYRYNSDRRIVEPLPLDQRNLSSSNGEKTRNWIHLLINLVRQGLRVGAMVDGRKVRIVSFNYDGILEGVLEEQFQNTEKKYAHYSNFIDIVHPHGVCGELNRKQIDSARELYDWSQQISVVNEALEDYGDIVQARNTASDWVADSAFIYAVGFAFAGPNCNMLGLRKKVEYPTKTLHYCNFAGSAGVKLAADRCTGIRDTHPTVGSWANPISVEDWFYSGVLGEFSA